jgi:WD40 repeat protein
VQFSAFDVAFSPDGQHVLMLGKRDTRLLDIANKAQTQVNWKLPTGSLGIALEQKAGKLQISKVFEGGPAALSGEINVGDELIGITQHGKYAKLLGSTVPNAVERLRGFSGAALILHLIPTGSAQPKEVRLVRAPGVIEGDIVRFPQPTPIPALPHACISVVDKTFAILSADQGHPLSAISPIELDSYGMYALSRDGRRFGLMASWPQKSSTTAVEIFDVTTGERTHFTHLPRHGFSGAAFSPDGKLFVAADYDRLNVFSLEDSVLKPPMMLTRDITVVPAERSVASESPAGKAAAAVQKEVGPLGGRSTVRKYNNALSSIAITRDAIAAIGTPVGTIEAWSLDSGAYLGDYLGQEFATGKPTEDVAFSPNGEWLASYSAGTLHLQNVAQKPWEKAAVESAPAGAGNP